MIFFSPGLKEKFVVI